MPDNRARRVKEKLQNNGEINVQNWIDVLDILLIPEELAILLMAVEPIHLGEPKKENWTKLVGVK